MQSGSKTQESASPPESMLKETSPARRWLWTAWSLTLVVVVVGSLMPGAWLARIQTDVAPLNDKLFHFAGYCLLSGLPALASRRPREMVGFAIATGVLGVALEFCQKLAPGRTVELADLGANNFGVLVGATLGWLFRGVVRL